MAIVSNGTIHHASSPSHSSLRQCSVALQTDCVDVCVCGLNWSHSQAAWQERKCFLSSHVAMKYNLACVSECVCVCVCVYVHVW